MRALTAWTVVGLAGAWALAGGCRIAPEPESGIPAFLTERADGARAVRGAELYSRHCAVCHGSSGRADGPASAFLFPPARSFPRARFRLVSSENGAPFERDLVATVRRGIPGSAMPAFGWLPEEDLWDLAAHVRALALEGLRGDLVAEARTTGDALLLAEADRIAESRTTPTRAVPRPPDIPRDPAALARGAEVFAEHCAQCHGADGGAVAEPRFDEDGTLNWARDLTAGFLKGGDAPYQLRCRIRAGMPGTAMPPTELAPDDELALLAFLRELLPAGSAERLVHRRASLLARRVARAPEEPTDAAWDAADEIEVVLAPLRWKPDAVLGASLAALHDGERVALRLSWPDSTGELRVFSESTTSDAAALQLSSADEPALFGMGTSEHPTNLWHWQALRLESVAGALDLADPPHARGDTNPGRVRADVPLYRRMLSRIEPAERVDAIVATGIPTVHAAAQESGIVGSRARWQDGRWSVVFARALAVHEAGQIELVPGRTLQVACAAWNGAVGDRGAEKSISIWQELVLEP